MQELESGQGFRFEAEDVGTPEFKDRWAKLAETSKPAVIDQSGTSVACVSPEPPKEPFEFHPAKVLAFFIAITFIIAVGPSTVLKALIVAIFWAVTGDNYRTIAAILCITASCYALVWAADERNAESEPSAPLPQGRQYKRRGDTIYGDARAADDWEIDEHLRDKTGGFAPLFKD